MSTNSRHSATRFTKGDLKLKILSKNFSFKLPLVDFVALCLLIVDIAQRDLLKET